MKKLNVKNIIRQNRKFGGSLLNKSNLEYDIEKANKEKNIYRSNAYVVRAMASGHSFLDGNKRTAAEILVRRSGKEGIKFDSKKVSKGMVDIAKKNISNINEIEKQIKKWKKK
jgi:prophage maintenance system killer protein